MSRTTGGATALAVALALVAVTSAPAHATVQEGVGHHTTPAQPYQGNPDSYDHLGSYLVGGTQVYSARFAYLAPDTDEAYAAAAPLKTKWGTDLPPDVSGELAYLLFAHGATTQSDTAAALSHLVHSRTSAPQNPGQLDPVNDFRHIAYDAPFHLAKLPAGAHAAVTALAAEAATHRGPWTVVVQAPASLRVGVAGSWTVHVTSATGADVGGREVSLDLTGAELPGGASSGTVQLDGTGRATLTVTPTDLQPVVAAALAGPTTTAVARPAVAVDTAAVVVGADHVTSYDGQASASAGLGTFAVGPTATLTGRPRVGRLLTASAGTTSPAGTTAFQWLSGDAVVGTGPTYRITLGDLGRSLRVVATVTRPGYTPATAISAATRPVRLPKGPLQVRVRARAELGDRLLVRAAGLVPGEACRVRLGGVPVRSCHADARGRVRVRIAVEGVAPGRRLVVVQGALPRRRGSDTVRVVTPG